MLVTIIWPITTLSDEAIVAYAQGVGLAYRGQPEEAIAAFDQALNEAPEYANALYERGNSHFGLGNYEAAAADYIAAQAAGREDAAVTGNLGWTYYLLGRFGEAVELSRQALAAGSVELGVHFNLALALLADGQLEAAQTEYANAMALASRQVSEAKGAGQQPSSSLWWYMDAGARDLQSLIDQLDGQPKSWTEAPPAESIANPEPVRTAAQTLSKQVKELMVALEYTGQPPAGLVTAQVTSFEFGQAQYDDEGNFVEYTIATTFPYGTDEVLVLFDYTGMPEGQETIWKVYHEGQEDPSLRVVEAWSLGQSGGAEKPISYSYSNVFIFTPGEYTVELYVDSHWIQGGSFVIENP
jgi:tetratricopeptide (TPR) repeat protein